jgi:hypothetical protein
MLACRRAGAPEQLQHEPKPSVMQPCSLLMFHADSVLLAEV